MMCTVGWIVCEVLSEVLRVTFTTPPQTQQRTNYSFFILTTFNTCKKHYWKRKEPLRGAISYREGGCHQELLSGGWPLHLVIELYCTSSWATLWNILACAWLENKPPLSSMYSPVIFHLLQIHPSDQTWRECVRKCKLAKSVKWKF